MLIAPWRHDAEDQMVDDGGLSMVGLVKLSSSCIQSLVIASINMDHRDHRRPCWVKGHVWWAKLQEIPLVKAVSRVSVQGFCFFHHSC